MKFFILLFFITTVATAQKVVKKSLVNSNISFIQIDANYCFEITLKTEETEEIVVEATIEGEYKKDLILQLIETGRTLRISAGFQNNFELPNDKLSAHKVISIALKIKLPRHKNVNIFGTSCNVIIEGDYEELKTTLNDGTCYLNDVVGEIEVVTQSGNIIVKSRAARVNAVSKYGIVNEQSIPLGNNHFKLNTITGNIELKKIE